MQTKISTDNSDQVDYLSLWPEPTRLKKALEEKRRGVCFTMPGLKSDKLLNVPISDEAEQCYDHHFSRVDVELNTQGLINLIDMCHLELALNATTVLLAKMGHGVGKAGKPTTITPTHLQLWGIRFQLLMALKLYSVLADELLPFEELDAPDLFYQYYSDSGDKTGSLVTFQTRLIHAEVLRFGSSPWKAIERIKRLESDVDKVIALLCTTDAPEEHITAWKSRLSVVQMMYARVLFFLGEYMLSLNTFHNIMQSSSDDKAMALLEGMCRMALSVGDEKAANKLLDDTTKSSTSPLLKAFRSLFLGAFVHAQEYLQKKSQSGLDSDPALNSLAICLLYSGKVTEAVDFYAKNIQLPSEPLHANLKAMLELGCSTAEKSTLLEDFIKGRAEKSN
ncbi:hypothetical protein KIN20_034088 [Parelaphostrongylus tenuis]|uniref:Trafficking protein particle complex subunit 12 n=1 Tax=Parelaphostrongylus tenuis TaxID=148309 RepID=A0AAD5R9M1_PARTN|nr:hypothetical protein KIN20_034088 [Parelaphostrongylus tenuis]